MSRVRACRLVGLNRSSLGYQPRRPDDAMVRQRLRELAAERRRFGYRRLGWLLAREGCRMNHKKLYRLYREGQLMVRRRGGRKRALGTRAPMALPLTINQRWSLDFVSDTLSDGRRFRILAIVDDFSRECLTMVVDTSLGGVRVVRELERLTLARGVPAIIVSDNGTELTSVAVLRWAIDRVAWHYDYNHVRPHSSLGALTPIEFADQQGDRPPEQAQGSAARPLAPPPRQGQNINSGLYS